EKVRGLEMLTLVAILLMGNREFKSQTREIIYKAVSAIILLLLKWFKVSHILKFEYFTQLLLDSNYLALTLKSIAHQEIEKVVNIMTDRHEKSDYSSFDGEQTTKCMLKDDIDDAVPPPIKLRRDTIASFETPNSVPSCSSQEEYSTHTQPIPVTDDVSNSNNVSADKMVYEFSWRNFFSLINLLRIMQKVCKNKTHRNLLLVQYKSSNILKRVLKISQPCLRLYTLKLFKNQVPFCGRRWRQGNMRVITAVYLHCRPELRDDWLAGGNISTDVDEALPLEQALRALTHWHNIKRYPSEMGINPTIITKENDFFLNELEKMEVQEDSIYDGEGIVDSGWEMLVMLAGKM
ncbi:Protein required for hyphal anastomosis, partial [Blumeria hordei DH14]